MSAEEQKEKTEGIVLAPAFDFTKFTAIGAAVAAIIGFLPQALKGLVNNNIPEGIAIAGLRLVPFALLSAAIAGSADVLARAWVKSAKLKSGSTDAPAASQHAIPLATTGTPFLLQVNTLSTTPLRVLAIRWDTDEKTTKYLVGEVGAQPAWVSHKDVQGVSYQ